MHLGWITVTAAAVLLTSGLATRAAGCPVEPAFEIGGTTVFRVGHGLGFVSPLVVDMDGAPNAYHRLGRKEGKALDTLCNAGKALPGDGRAPYHGSAPNRCGEFLRDVATAEAAGWTGPTAIEWYGLATRDRAKRIPYTQTEGPTKGFYVSTTALSDPVNHPEKSDVGRYLDARTVPYFVVPSASPFIVKGRSGLRDLVVSWSPRSEEVSFGIVGDVGPAGKLGEASAAFVNGLRRPEDRIPSDRMTYKTASHLTIGKPIVTIIFPGSRMPPPYTPQAVWKAAREQFEKWGGLDRMRGCAGALGLKKT